MLLCLALLACSLPASARSDEAKLVPTPAETPCGAAAAETVAAAAGFAASRIYLAELASTEVTADRRQVEGDGPLLRALAAGDDAETTRAVTRLVYSHTHIVRLRVTRGRTVLADVGGPYILAPVAGVLRLGGREVGRYVLSVQDDLGYVKLESRFVGLPLLLRRAGQRIPLEGSLAAERVAIPTHGALRYRGARYLSITLAATAFPSGALEITLLVPVPRPSALGCTALRVGELARIGRTVWHRYSLIGGNPAAFAITARGITGQLSYVRAGSRQLAGSTNPGPTRLPDSGTLVYRGTRYAVSSFPAHLAGVSVRVFQLYRT